MLVVKRWFLNEAFSPEVFYQPVKYEPNALNSSWLTLKAPITAAADDIHNIFSLFFRENKTWCFKILRSSARQRIYMKNQALFSSKDKSKKSKCCLLQFSFRALRVNLFNKISSNWRSSGSKEHIEETKTRGLGVIESVHVHYCCGATLPTSSSTVFSRILFSNWLRMSPMIPKNKKRFILQYDDVWGDFLRLPHGITPALMKSS